MDGVLLIDKPKGWTSFDVVAKVRGVLKSSGVSKPKVGHSGTLDPLATGLLVLLLGSYTKRATALTKLDKIYEVTMKLGETSTTGDEEGEKTRISSIRPLLEEIKAILVEFTGELTQIPPAYSAVKINGQRAYKLARAGKTVELEPRSVTIYKNELLNYDYPLVKFTSHVSSGTYLRSLVSDIGEQLQTGAYMSDLRRIKVGRFDIKNAQSMENLSLENIYKNLLMATA